MNGPIGHTFLYNIIIIFILVVFGFLAGVLSYYKAFKINNNIVHAVEKFEGYNSGSIEEIENKLNTIGYTLGQTNCAEEYRSMRLVTTEYSHKICIYIDNEKPVKGEYYTYGVLTYMNIDLPLISRINIPVFTKTNRIYKFD